MENFIENGYKIVKLDLLLGFNGGNLTRNNIFAVYGTWVIQSVTLVLPIHIK